MSLTILQLTSPIKINSEPRYIVMENVIDFRESGIGTKLTFISGRSEEVKEKPKEILKKLAQLNRSIKPQQLNVKKK